MQNKDIITLSTLIFILSLSPSDRQSNNVDYATFAAKNLSAVYLQFAILKCTASIFYPDWCNLYYVRNCNNGKLSLTASNKYSKFIPSFCTLLQNTPKYPVYIVLISHWLRARLCWPIRAQISASRAAVTHQNLWQARPGQDNKRLHKVKTFSFSLFLLFIIQQVLE